MKRLLSFLPLLISWSLYAQVDTTAIRRIYYRAMHLTEAKTDSIGYYADFINHIYLKEQYAEAKPMSLRIYGYFFENKGNYPRAIDYYLQALDAARKLGLIKRQIEILTDLAAVYTSDMKQPQKAKDLYQECLRLNRQLGDVHSLLNSYMNLGAIYDRLGLYGQRAADLEGRIAHRQAPGRKGRG